MNYRDIEIKKKNGSIRKICAPDKELLKYQRGKLKYLEALYKRVAVDYGISEVAHGFIRGRNCVTAAKKHVGFNTTVIMDISNFFDSVYSRMLQQFDSSIASDPLLFHRNNYAGQGFATSPLIANIAILPAIKEITSVLSSTLRDYALTIYADDIQVSINKEPEDDYTKEHFIENLVSAILSSNGFTLNAKKTRVRYANRGFRKILGINVGDSTIRASRNTMRKIRAARHQNNGSSLGGLTTWSKCYLPRNY